jgi:hypothetical protein
MKDGKIRRIPVRKQYEHNSFKLYPNPAGEYVIVEYTMAGITPNGYVVIYDNKGTIVKTHSLGKNHDYNVIQVNDLSSGIYYCNFVVNGKLVQSEKLIILN